MKANLFRALASATLALLVSSAAIGGSITAVMAPSTAVVGHPVTITIQGRGPCSAIAVNYNTAGIAVTTYSTASFPFSPPPHTYVAAGTKTVLVTATGNCTGRATTTITVTAAPPPPPPPTSGGFVVPESLRRLCGIVPCAATATAFLRPTLSGSPSDSVQPGQVLMVSGFSLGTSPGSIRMRLPNGSPANVTVTSWSPFAVTGTLDDSITGVRDGDAQVIVQRSDNVLSNALAIHFRARREETLVPPRYVSVVSCADAAVVTQCDASNHVYTERIDFARIFGGSLRLPDQPLGDAAYSGRHENFWDDFGASGTDSIAFDLPEGFAINATTIGAASGSDAIDNSRFHNGSIHTTLPAAGTQRGTIRVDWRIGGGSGAIDYDGILLADGPAGIELPR
ncbi:MAG TPA: hypothetical protein VFS34_04100 [Thermoanaerobaculia bacterium]|nr:hypothetical protein [Thermoanaerobaculia bacterium]